MPSMISRLIPLMLLCGLSVPQMGCQTKAGTGAALGSGAGALAGAIIGHQTGNAAEGALIGAALGGAGGGLYGHSQDEKDRADAAVAHAAHTDMMRQAEQRALTNAEVIQMAQNGFSDQHVIMTIQHRGGRFQTDPASQSHLKQNGVSEPVMQAMMRYGYTQ